MSSLKVLLSAVAALSLAGPVIAQDTLKIGVVNASSGQFADPAAQLDAGIALWLAEHDNMIAGKTVELIKKDSGGIAPDVAKRLAEELVVRDQVDVLVGGLLTPNAMAVGDVSAEAEKFFVVMNATTPVVTTKSPYMIRVSATSNQINYTFGEWVAGKGVKNAYTMVTDYGPGLGAAAGFKAGFEAGGGTIVGEDKTPVANPDFAPFVQRIADAKPEALYVFVPGGTQPPALGKALSEREVTPATTGIYAQGELTDDAALAAMGDAAVGIVTVYHYDVARDDPTNAAFVEAYRAANNGRNPDVYSIGGYDGMEALSLALEKTGGDTSGPALAEAAKGLEWQSPRGMMSIDPETREPVQTIWIREVQMVDGKPQNVIIDQVDNAKNY
jgi:branched-chain amino acid transport system substrate-binding protein